MTNLASSIDPAPAERRTSETPAPPAWKPEDPDDAAVWQGIELLFYAYRDFIAEPDAILARYGFGRAHHRIVHFVGRHPNMTVGELLCILRITKQSLSRVLGQLVRQGFVVQHTGPFDRRQRRLALTGKGCELARLLSAPQRARIGAAFRAAGPEAVAGFRTVMLGIVALDADRASLERPMAAERAPAAAKP